MDKMIIPDFNSCNNDTGLDLFGSGNLFAMYEI